MKNTADNKLMRRMNSKIVIDLIRNEAPVSRANLSAITGLNRSTVSSIIDDLIHDGWVQETALESGKVGRPGILLEINPCGGFAIGLEIGVDFVLGVCVDFSVKKIWNKIIEIDPNEGQTKILQIAFTLTSEAIEFGKQKCAKPLGIGIAVPGLVDIANGVLKIAPNLHWEDVPLRLLWTQEFNLPVQVENEANAAALGEFHYGAASGIKNLIYIAAGYGLGSGIIVDGKLLRGNKGYAAEVGHMTIYPDGLPCNCGKRGCYETIISPRAVIDRINKIIKENGGDSRYLNKPENGLGYDAVVDAANHHDQVALKALENVGRDLGLLVSNLVNIFNPKMVILGGALNYAKDYIQKVVLDVVEVNALKLCQEDLIITNSELDPFSAVMGMISLVNEKSFSEWLN